MLKQSVSAQPAAQALFAWNGQLLKDSVAALRYAYWRMTLEEHAKGPELRARVDDHYAIVEDRAPRPLVITALDQALVQSTWQLAMTKMTTDLGTLDAPWGRVFRVGRGDQSWPVEGGGGDAFGLTTLRAMGYGAPNASHERWGERGQTSTQVVVLSKPIASFMYLPQGQSDRPDSAHFSDQARLLFSERNLKPTWWLPEDLQQHIESRTELDHRDR